MKLAPGTHVVPGLRLIRTIGEGAIGSVWLAEQEGRGQVAVKFLLASAAKHKLLAARFKREADAAAKMSNLHVVQVYSHGETADGDAFVVMEYLEGESLADRLGRSGQLPIELTAELVPQLGSALQAAHEVGLVHRDIKPANVFLVGTQEHPVLKVLDFGVAKDLRVKDGSVVTGTGVAVGSPLTMSPEQVLGSRHVDYRSDLWSFAVVVYRLVCGRLPFLANNPNALAFAICRAQYTPPSEAGAPPQLDAWFQRAFQPAKEKRFQSAREQATAFLRALSESSAVATDPLDESTMDGESSSSEGGAITLPSGAVSLLNDDGEALTLDDGDDDAETLQRQWSEAERDRMQALVDQMEASMAASSGDEISASGVAPAPSPSRTPQPPPRPSQPIQASPSWPAGSHPSEPSKHSLAAVSKPSQSESASAPPAPPKLVSSTPAAPVRSMRGAYWLAAGLAAAAALILVLVRGVGLGDASSATPTASAESTAPSAAPPASAPSASDVADTTAASAAAHESQAEASPSASASAVAEGRGKLSILCVPGCSDVRVDGSSWGPSPVFEREVEAGPREVVLYQGALLAKKLTMNVEADTLTTERVILDTVAPRPPTPKPTASSAASTAVAAPTDGEPPPSPAPESKAPSAPEDQPD